MISLQWVSRHIKAAKLNTSYKLDRTEEAELNFYLLKQIWSESSDGAQDLLEGRLLYAKHFHCMNLDCMFDLFGWVKEQRRGVNSQYLQFKLCYCGYEHWIILAWWHGNKLHWSSLVLNKKTFIKSKSYFVIKYKSKFCFLRVTATSRTRLCFTSFLVFSPILNASIVSSFCWRQLDPARPCLMESEPLRYHFFHFNGVCFHLLATTSRWSVFVRPGPTNPQLDIHRVCVWNIYPRVPVRH